jgi:hypothetical protein
LPLLDKIKLRPIRAVTARVPGVAVQFFSVAQRHGTPPRDVEPTLARTRKYLPKQCRKIASYLTVQAMYQAFRPVSKLCESKMKRLADSRSEAMSKKTSHRRSGSGGALPRPPSALKPARTFIPVNPPLKEKDNVETV